MVQSIKYKNARFLVFSAAFVAIICAGIFTFLAVYMSHRSVETINEVARIYMSSMSEQITLHFKTTIELRLDQVKALVEAIPAVDGREHRQCGRPCQEVQRPADLSIWDCMAVTGMWI